jgi:hypothetical protein
VCVFLVCVFVSSFLPFIVSPLHSCPVKNCPSYIYIVLYPHFPHPSLSQPNIHTTHTHISTHTHYITSLANPSPTVSKEMSVPAPYCKILFSTCAISFCRTETRCSVSSRLVICCRCACVCVCVCVRVCVKSRNAHAGGCKKCQD